jgi:hypothetical protein
MCLEDWLPFDSSSQATSTPIDGANSESRTGLKFETNVQANNSGAYTPESKVEFVKATGIRRWILPFKVSKQ